MTDEGGSDGQGGDGAPHGHAQILFTLPQEEGQASQLDEEREKHRARAAKFGTQYRDPGRVRKDFSLMMEARRERQKQHHGFTTGALDLFAPEEQEKRAARASRFQLAEPLAPALDQYRPDAELEARARRAAKFGVPYQPTEAVLMDMDLFEARREVSKDVERRPEAIYLYGVDVMSTKEVLSYFGEYGPVFVEWLDDSSCNVLFADANSVKRALVGKGTPLPPEVVAQRPWEQQQQPGEPDAMEAEHEHPQGEGEAAPAAGGAASTAAPSVRYQPELPVPDNLADVANLPYVWHKGKDFVKAGTTVSLVYRMATAADVRDMKEPKRTRELWKTGDGGGRGGRGRGRGPRLGKRSRGDGSEDMDVDGEGGEEGEGEGRGKRQRGFRGGQRLLAKEAKSYLGPYGGSALLAAGGAPLPNTATLDYTELEDEAPPSGEPLPGAGGQRDGEEGGEEGGQGGGRGRGRRGRGGRGRAQGPDLREVLKALRPKLPAPRKGTQDMGWGGVGAEEAAAEGELLGEAVGDAGDGGAQLGGAAEADVGGGEEYYEGGEEELPQE
ncbi:hypothetical protein HYH03_000204 [Edaphochlamys debaryana]|uniref:Nuclear cap-binding protein subunit 3 n=1 Tax=Edaphochlamys debaryana TaxID=47281 RepID=A0A836C6Z6_9CHLO|nr:hypothetical protein HYH03_000204 [Edaphochlamys debaryana]|eukprot:KAG2501703.1 hypothetical protein HYH03_000204 [Edaphochlamys debaryana]